MEQEEESNTPREKQLVLNLWAKTWIFSEIIVD